ncbi:MAG: NAD(P)/FAD-dependent oxidoreductase [Verrucomicrobiota bacterium]|nr:NAD(P)/FAD-dependent oxidoreductase [Verrucomicrobiota bacterium]
MYDVIIIGAGHNGLICAGYLARAGRKVLVLERRNIVGGAVCTEEIIPGYKFDVGSSAHIMIHATPVVKDLELSTKYGLEYIPMDPWGYYPIQGTDQGITFWKDIDKTCQSIAQIAPRDAEAYRDFVRHWMELNEGVFETFLQPPTPGRIAWTMFKRNLRNWRSRKLWSSLDTSRQLMAPYGQIIDELFENIHLKTALLWLSAQSGPAPSELASGDMFGWNAMMHKIGAARAKGGSGALTQALQRMLLAHGARIELDAEVESVEQIAGGWRVGTKAGEYEGKKVVSACHIQTLFGKLLRGAPDKLRKRVSKVRVGNGFGMIVRHAVEELPIYSAQMAADGKTPRDYHSALQLLCPSPEYLKSSHRDFLFGLPPREPSVVAMSFSAIDPTLAPEGKHTLFTWGQYHPYELSNGENWDDIAEREADKLYELVCQYAPNMRGKMIGRYIQTPLEIERKLGLIRANVMHVEMSIDQMFMWRPLPELSAYRVPDMPGLYLTGASTHPGGGVFGASGLNTARVILADG